MWFNIISVSFVLIIWKAHYSKLFLLEGYLVPTCFCQCLCRFFIIHEFRIDL